MSWRVARARSLSVIPEIPPILDPQTSDALEIEELSRSTTDAGEEMKDTLKEEEPARVVEPLKLYPDDQEELPLWLAKLIDEIAEITEREMKVLLVKFDSLDIE